MILVFIQAVLVIGAGVGLFLLWRVAAPPERWLRYVVAAGFLARALAGQALFWISWARLPVARSLQAGNGLWFFANDAKLYFPSAVVTAWKGLWAIATFDRSAPARIYIQTLSVAVWLVGAVASTAVLLNLFFYLGMVAVITRWPVRDPRARTAAGIAVTAISLSPAFILWTLQPLKDTYFQFLFVAFIAACAAWQRAWAAEGQRGRRIAAGALLMVLLYALSSIRWYFGFALLLAASFFLLLMAFEAKGRRVAAVAAAVLLAILLSRAFVAGSNAYLPPLIADALNPKTTLASARTLPAFLLKGIESARASFDAAGGDTSIRLGTPRRPAATIAAAKPAPQLTPAPPPPPAALTQSTATVSNSTAPPATSPATQSVSATAAPAPPPKPQTAAPVVVRNDEGGGEIQKPASRGARLVTGAAVVVLPRSIGEWLGLFHIGGGRGMLWFTEIDTIIFDAALLLALFAVATRFRVAVRDPLTWLTLLVTLLVGIPLMYSISNFGTLFRLREMIYIGLVLTPLAVAAAFTREEKTHA